MVLNWLDEVLTGRRRDNEVIRRLFAPDAVAASEQVEVINPGVAVTTRRRDDPGAIAAATAFQRTTGLSPQNRFRGVANVIPIGSEEAYNAVVAAGVQEGTPVSELFRLLGGENVSGVAVSRTDAAKVLEDYIRRLNVDDNAQSSRSSQPRSTTPDMTMPLRASATTPVTPTPDLTFGDNIGRAQADDPLAVFYRRYAQRGM